ncbi:MAG: helix-hairpin-helix domain-containing protein [Candidatus Treponema excrementipullorum]|nr:helix-hairpin-helix domain-containing protein [Candidatus Treponema excrementipullorum]MDY4708578.1 helix-hairpin-helix domain-containing protein [Candidatus Treponema excrementipullorum]
MSELRQIPNVGQQTEQDLIAMGYTTLESLKGKKAEDLYREECALRGFEIDRCQLYLYRAVEYFVNTENPDPEKCK